MQKHDHLHSLPLTSHLPEPEWTALNYGAKYHEGQVRKISGEHFIVHPYGTYTIVCQVTDHIPTRQAALLHDTVEDTSVTFEQLQQDFGPETAFLVWGVTKDETIQDKHWRDAAYLRRLEFEAAEGSVLIALADKIDNLTDKIEGLKCHGNEMWQHFTSTPEGDIWWFTSVLEIGRHRIPDCPLNDHLESLVREFGLLALGQRARQAGAFDV